MISDRFSKLTINVALCRMATEVIAQAFVAHWVFVCGTIAKLFSAYGSQLSSRFFTAVCKLFRVGNYLTAAYHLHTIGQVER